MKRHSSIGSGAVKRSPVAGSQHRRVGHGYPRAELHGAGRVRPTIGFVSTYPPTQCGIATFTQALRRAIAGERHSDDGLNVVSLVEERLAHTPQEVVYQHLNGDRASLQVATRLLSNMDVVVVQHEFGIYGGTDGEEVLDFVSAVSTPVVVVLHTVPRSPTPNQRRILETLGRDSDQLVVLSRSALDQLLSIYDVDAENVRVIPHGAFSDSAKRTPAHGRPLLLTWGLIGPGKGLEMAIEAAAYLKDLSPMPRYLIQGETHPKVREASGDAYLNGLKELVHHLGLEGVVEFDSRYTDRAALNAIVRSADLVVLPYESTEQVTSGVLVEAIAGGNPVVATDFPHAVEMLSTGAGTVVPHADPKAMAVAIRQVLTEPGRMAAMGRAARAIGATLDWARIADTYQEMFAGLVVTNAQVIELPVSSPQRAVAALLPRSG